MARPVDSFWIDLTINHPDCDPEVITCDLGLQPWFAAQRGQTIGAIVRKNTGWLCHFREGLSSAEFGPALEDVLELLNAKDTFFGKLNAEGGTAQLTINQSIAPQDGISFSLQLEAYFLRSCGKHDVSLHLQAWTAKDAE